MISRSYAQEANDFLAEERHMSASLDCFEEQCSELDEHLELEERSAQNRFRKLEDMADKSYEDYKTDREKLRKRIADDSRIIDELRGRAHDSHRSSELLRGEVAEEESAAREAHDDLYELRIEYGQTRAELEQKEAGLKQADEMSAECLNEENDLSIRLELETELVRSVEGALLQAEENESSGLMTAHLKRSLSRSRRTS